MRGARAPGGLDHLADRPAHLPVEVTRRSVSVGDDAGRVARTPRRHLRGEVDPRHLGHGRHDLADAQPVARTQVVGGLKVATLHEGPGGRDVRDGEVADVHVVADAGAVGRRVVVAVDARRATGEQHLDDDREQVVRADVVHVVGGRADHVEVAQIGATQRGPRAHLVGQQPLTDELALSVGRLGAQGKIFGDHVDIGGAVDGGRRREHVAVDASLGHRLEDADGAGHVLRVRVQRLLHRDAGVLEAGHVDDALAVVFAQSVGQQPRVEDAALDELRTLGDELAAS